MENLYASTGQGADGGAFRSDLHDTGRKRTLTPPTPPLQLLILIRPLQLLFALGLPGSCRIPAFILSLFLLLGFATETQKCNHVTEWCLFPRGDLRWHAGRVEEADVILQRSEGGVDSALLYAKTISKYMKDLISYVEKRISLGECLFTPH